MINVSCGAYCIAWYGRVLHYTSVVFSYVQINLQIKTRVLCALGSVWRRGRERVLKDIKRFFLCFCDDKLKGTKRARHWANGAESDERAVDVELPSLGGQHLIPRHKPSPNQTPPTSVLRIRSLSPPLCSQQPSC